MATKAEKDAAIAAATQKLAAATAREKVASVALTSAQAEFQAAGAAVLEAQSELDAANALVVEPDPDYFITEPMVLNSAAVVAPKFLGDGRYSRDQIEVELTADTFRLQCDKSDYPAGGADRVLKGTVYTVRGAIWNAAVDPKTLSLVTLGKYTRTLASVVDFDIPLTFPADMPDGVLYCEMSGDSPTSGESFPSFCMLLDRKGECPKQRYAYVTLWNYQWAKDGYQQLALVDKRLLGNTILPMRYVQNATPFTSMLSAAKGELVVDQYVAPVTGRETNRPFRTKRGNISFADNDPYPYADVSAAHVSIRHTLTVGPRGQASFELGLTPFVMRNGGVIAAGPYNLRIYRKDGFCEPMAGPYHIEPAYHADIDIANMPIAGDWWDDVNNAPVPRNEQRVTRCWGITALPWTTTLNESLPMIDGEHQHGKPVCFGVTDNTRGGRLLEVSREFRETVNPDGTRTPVIWKVRVKAYLNDPWGIDCVPEKEQILIAVRGDSRIAIYDKNYRFVGDWLKGTTFLGAEDRETVWRRHDGVTLAQVRAYDVIAPESVVYYKGLVYYGGLAMEEFRRRPFDKSTPHEICWRPTIGNNSNFLMLDIARDGSFGPDAAFGYGTWGLANNGWPVMMYPKAGFDDDGAVRAVKDANGVIIGYDALDASNNVTATFMYPAGANATQKAATLTKAKQANGTPMTHTGRWYYEPSFDISYPGKPALGYGRMVCPSAMHALPVIRQKDASDLPPVAPSAARTRGAEFYKKHFQILHGAAGNGFVKLPLPFGVNVDCDEYMRGFERVRWATTSALRTFASGIPAHPDPHSH